jgi:hypothetical protein
MGVKYPKEVLTVSKKGKVEVRSLVDRGRYIRYEYLDPETGRKTENKVKLVLIGEKVEEYFMIPTKDGKRYLLLPLEPKGERMVWDGEKAVEL